MINRDYAAALATALQKRFWGPLARKKSPKVHLDIPPPGVVRNSSPLFGQALAQPVQGPLNFFPPDI